MTLRPLIFLIALFAVAAAACSTSATAEQEFSETPTAVKITSGAGDVTVTADDSGASVTAEISAAGEETTWSAEMVGGELVIDDGCGDRADCEVDFSITVAGTADVAIDTDDGTIAVVDMNSSVTIRGSARSVGLNGIIGPLTVDLVKGDVLGARLVSTDAFFNTGDGDLDVTLTEAFDSLTVTSGSGDVTAQVPDGDYDIDASGTGTIDIKVNDVDGAAPTIVMATDSGDVTIYKR